VIMTLRPGVLLTSLVNTSIPLLFAVYSYAAGVQAAIIYYVKLDYK